MKSTRDGPIYAMIGGQTGFMEQIRRTFARFAGFFHRQDGAVTVDWVVLTGVVVGIGMAAAFIIGANIPGLADQVSDTMVSMDVTP